MYFSVSTYLTVKNVEHLWWQSGGSVLSALAQKCTICFLCQEYSGRSLRQNLQSNSFHNSIHSLTTLLCHSIKIRLKPDRKPVKENCAQMNLLTETRLFCDMIRVKAMWTWKKSSGSVICQAGRYVSGKTGMLQGQTAAPGSPSRLCRLQTWMTLTLSVSYLCMRSQGF